MQSLSFYHDHLENVSRSFSFCIMQLLSPAREWVALSYLLGRIADTIEDSVWLDKTLQCSVFQQIKSFLKEPPTEEQFFIWLTSFPEHIPSSEKKLLADLPLLLIDIQSLPSDVQKQLIKTFSNMIDGMLYFVNHPMKNDTHVESSLITTNQYCFFVAGIIGELLTYIFTHLIPAFEWTDTLLIQSFHFGLFLQKINILKDQRSDEAAGRFYISSRDCLRTSLHVNAQESWHYIKSIPIVPGRTYRLFCAWSLFIGLASLKWIDKSWQMNDLYKITRRETSYIMNQITQMIDDNHALEILFNRYMPKSNTEKFHQHHNQCRATWFNNIYSYNFSEKDATALGIGL